MKKVLILIFVIVVIYSCTDKFDIVDTGDPVSQGSIGDTLYIQQNPVWDGFNKPQDIIVGREPFLYVADTENDRIVMLDVAGQRLGELAVPHPTAIAQDYDLSLIICGTFDSAGVTYSAVYRADLFSAQHQIGDAGITRLLPKTSFDFSRPERQYTGVCVFQSNLFYVSRKGPVNSSPVDPDNSILMFSRYDRGDGVKVDTLLGRVPQVEPLGTGLVAAYDVSSITSFERNNIDMVVTMIGNNSFRVQWLEWVVTPLYSKYESKLSAFSSELMTVNKFGQPEDAAVDEYMNIYVADAEKDSIYKFNSFGDEMESFGGPDVFDSPHAIAHFDKTLYVVDTNNDRILRYILSTEID